MSDLVERARPALSPHRIVVIASHFRQGPVMSIAPHEASERQYEVMPGWVKWFVIAAVVVVLVVVVALLSGGKHGPGRHMSSPAQPSAVTTLTASSSTWHSALPPSPPMT